MKTKFVTSNFLTMSGLHGKKKHFDKKSTKKYFQRKIKA